MNEYKIMIVDDEEEVRKAIVKKMDWESLGFEVVADAENGMEALEKAVLGCKSRTENLELALYYKDTVLAAMQELRAVGDEIEALIGEGYLPYPTYGQLLFGV